MKPTELAPVDKSELISNLVLNGDISKMSNEMKVEYYNRLCHSLNLNPVTKPFQIISFQGKTILYATKDCTEQLRKINRVSIVDLTQDLKEGLCISKCKVQDKDNRFDIATGAVNIAGLKGDALANAIMKSETKSKRRATLSICGLGILDESELDTMPAYQTADITQLTAGPQSNPFKEMKNAKSIEDIKRIWNENKSLQSDNAFLGLSKQKKAEIIAKTTVEPPQHFQDEQETEYRNNEEEYGEKKELKRHPLNPEPEKFTPSDILGEVEEAPQTETFITESIAKLSKAKTVTGLNSMFKELRNNAAYLFLDESEKNEIIKYCQTKKSEINGKK